jgi:hypothetical protein
MDVLMKVAVALGVLVVLVIGVRWMWRRANPPRRPGMRGGPPMDGSAPRGRTRAE